MKNKRNFNISLVTLFIGVAFQANAVTLSDVRPFVDFDAGIQLDYTSPVLGVATGLQLTPSWSADVGYQSLGKGEGGKSDSISATASLITLGVRYDLELNNRFSIYSRLGAAYFDVEKKELNNPAKDASGPAPMGEVGVKYQFNDNLSFDAGYQLVLGIGDDVTKEYDSNALMLGVRYQFNPFAKEVLPQLPPVVIEPKEVKTTVEEVITTPVVMNKTVTVKKNVDGVLFATNSSVLEDIRPLMPTLLLLQEDADATLLIAGHTDSTGSAKFNQRMSERRAASIAQYFENNGIAQSRIKSVGYGESRPIASNATAEGKKKNRRVELEITMKESKSTVVNQETIKKTTVTSNKK